MWQTVITSVSGIKKCDRLLLQSVSGITNCDRLYYKVHQALQTTTIITKWDVKLVWVYFQMILIIIDLYYLSMKQMKGLCSRHQ